MAARIKFQPDVPVFRNTWRNGNGHIRVEFYESREKAEYSALSCNKGDGALFQEIGTTVWPHQCEINPEEFYG